MSWYPSWARRGHVQCEPHPEQTTPKSTTGKIYAEHVNSLLASEYDRRKVLEARGDSVIKTSAGIVALIFALVVFISGKDYKFTDHWDSIWFLVAALIAFIISAGFAVYVQNWALKYTATGRRTLERMPQQLWDLPDDDAMRMCLTRNINTILSLREGNDQKVAAAQYSVVSQIIAITLLSISLVCELSGHR